MAKEVWMIDLPSPFAPMRDLHESLRSLEAMSDNVDRKQELIAEVREMIAYREAEDRKGRAATDAA